MKNLKKVLALVLVVATLMGFATVASAKFSDAESIKYTEAVDVMSMLNVINGYTDGSFRPTANVTRAQMAKMVAYIVAGGEDVGNLYKGANSFSDCTTHWAKGYIAYASKTGIVAGVGGGKFNPEGSVTGTQAAKMMLCALGYDATFETYTGANWAVNVLNRANEIGLLDGLSGVDMSAAMTREQAAQMMFNALTCTMVKYANGGTTIKGPDGWEINTGASTAEEVKNSKANDYRTNEEDWDEVMQLCEKYFSDLKLDDSAAAVDAFGRPSNEWTYDDDTVTASKTPAFTYTADTKASVIAKDMKNYTVALKTAAKDGKVQSDIGDTADTVEDVVYTDGTTAADLNVEAKKSPADAIAKLTANGTSVEIYTNKKAVTDIIVVNTYLAKVDNISKNKDDKSLQDVKFVVYDNSSTVGGVKTLAEQDGFAYDEDDYVLVNLADKAVKNVTAVKTAEGTAKTQAADYYTVDGTKYSLSAMFGGLNDAADDYTGTYTFYLDPYGNIIGATEVEAGEADLQYVWLKAIDVTLPTEFKDGAVKAKMTFMDGTTKTVDLAVKYSKLSGETDKTWNVINPATGEWTKIDSNGMETAGGAITIAAGFYTYTVNSENAYTLKALNANYAKAVKYSTPDKVTANVVSGYSANSSTKLVMVDANKTYTGYKNFPTTDDVSGVSNKDALAVYGKGSTTLKALYVMADEAVLENVTYAYSTSASKAYTEDGEDYYKFYVDGEIKYYQITGSVKADTIYKLDISDGVATPSEITSSTEYKTGVKYNAVLTTQTVSEISGEDYFKVGSTLYYLGYDKDDAVCGVYDLDNDGAKDTVSKDDKVTIVSITVDEQNYALAVYIEAE